MAKPIPELPDHILEKFYSLCSPPDSNSCIIWTGRKYHGGYGYLKYQNRHLSAHRIAFHLKHGNCNLDLQLNHCCTELSSGQRIDRPDCVNPDHLYEGTARDNMQDALKRNSVGKLSFNDATRIRERYRLGESVSALASEYEVGCTHIRAILFNRSWKDDNFIKYYQQRRYGRKRELDEDQIIEFQTKYVQGAKRKDLQEEYGISQEYTRILLNGLKQQRITKTEIKKLEADQRKLQKQMLHEQIRKEFMESQLTVPQTIQGLMDKYGLGHYQIHKILNLHTKSHYLSPSASHTQQNAHSP